MTLEAGVALRTPIVEHSPF